jgi:4a-hydroxytetrahydrobiopterin dehydratase
MSDLATRHCAPCEGGTALDANAARALLARLDGWSMDAAVKAIQRTFEFKNFHETMAFVNAVAYVAHREDHHPDLEVGYKRCVVRYSTHAVKGLSENDFICAAKVDALVAK